MNDFSEIENELKKLRPAQPSAVLLARVEEALEDCGAGALPAPRAKRQPDRLPYNWLSLGVGLAAAALLLLLAHVKTDQTQEPVEEIAQSSPAYETRSTSSNEFIPAGATQVVYNTRDEGLQFTDSSEQPLRRVRYQMHDTWQWRNPATGASLRVSYPSEEVVLTPISGQ